VSRARREGAPQSGGQFAGVPAWPTIEINLDGDEHLTVNDIPIPVPPGTDPHTVAVAAASDQMSALGLERPVRAKATDPDGTVWPLIIHPDGTATAAGEPTRPDQNRGLLRRVRAAGQGGEER
jgi:hypothetical protein